MHRQYPLKLTSENIPNSDLYEISVRREEYSPQFKDTYSRFTHYLSANRDVLNPVVSNEFVKNGYSAHYLDNKPFAVCLTHDIDALYSSILSRAYHFVRAILLDKNTSQAKLWLKSFINKKLPYSNLNEIMDLEAAYGAKSSFYFLALEKGEKDFNYHIEDISHLLKEIDERGWEVGLHGGHDAWSSYEKLSEEKSRLEKAFGKEVGGYRNHYLHFKVPDTWEHLSKAGFLYDTTFGYADCVGFRNGMCHPYTPFNLNTNKDIPIIEIPLIVMDGTLFDGYMRLTKETALSLVKELIDKTAELHGVFTLLWHNSYLVKGTWQREMYEQILQYCCEKNAWMTSGKEIAEWISQRNSSEKVDYEDKYN